MRSVLALGLALLLPAVAAAQPIDQDSAGRLQHDLESWFASWLGASQAIPRDWLHVTPEGDHFRADVLLLGATQPAAVTGDIRPSPGGIWAVDALRLPPSARFHLDLPGPGRPAGTMVPTDLDWHVGSQHTTALIDPALSAPSRLDLDLGNAELQTASAQDEQVQHFDRYTLHATLQPDGGRLDLIEQNTVTGWRSASRVDDKPAVGIGADRVVASGRVDGIDPARVTALVAATAGLVTALPPGATEHDRHVPLPPPQLAALRALIEALPGVATAMQGKETIDGLHVAIGDRGEATVRHATLGFSGAASDGMLHASLTVALDGLTVQHMAPEAAALVPSHLLLRPSVSGVPLAALTALALAATEPHADPARLQADAEALLTHGGITAGLDAMEVDIGPASLHGRGQVAVTGPDGYQARLHLVATGFDALMRQAAGNPALQHALPLLAMARGFARPEDDHLVWDIVANPAGLTVNGVPLSGGHPDRR